jgi:addiction module HigA family antidote
MSTRKAIFAVHPGEILRTEFMEPLGFTAYRLAKELHVSAPRMNDVVRGKRSISADTAIRLAKFFGTSARMWLNLQNDFDLRLASGSAAHKEVKPLKKTA